jgi:hypothetical protein
VDLSKPSSSITTTTPAKVPTLKLNIKNVTNSQVTTNSVCSKYYFENIFKEIFIFY